MVINVSRRWFTLAHLVWLVCGAMAALFLLAAIPLGYAPYVAQATVPYLKGLYFASAAVSFLVAFVSIVLSGVLFWKRRDEVMALFVSFFLLAYGITTAGPLELLAASHKFFLPAAISQAANALFLLPILFLFLFPNGRFVPSWTRWTALLVILLIPLVINLNATTGVEFSDLRVDFIYFIFLGLVSAGIYAQVIRYRRSATPIERQQIKWGAFGVSLYLFIIVVTTIPYALISDNPTFNTVDAWTPLGDLTWWLLMSIVPLTLVVAVMRYRLWDIDLIIYRALLYGALTAGIVLLYILIVGGLSLISETSGNLWISLLATGIIAILFQPLREKLQRGVNRLVYGERDDPYQVLSQFGQRLESTLAPDAMLSTIVATVAQALKLPYAALALTAKDDSHRIDVSFPPSVSQPPPGIVRLPLTYQSETLGEFIVAPRTGEENFSVSDLRLLNDLARQAGIAAYAVRVNGELQHSREQLVTAREEERRRIRRDLHDGLGPALASLSLKLDASRNYLETNPGQTNILLVEIKAQVQAAIEDIRRLVYELRPPALDELGLVSAIREQAAQYNINANDLRVLVIAPENGLPMLPAAVEVAAYRIALESLTNVVRHAQARCCEIRISLSDGLQIDIYDDGIGIPPVHRWGVGLASMRERAAELGGTCVVERSENGGTRVVARIPM